MEDKIAFHKLIEDSRKFQQLKRILLTTTQLSVTGITNLVVNYENPTLVDDFLHFCFKPEKLYKGTVKIDAVELQKGAPGSGNGIRYLDDLIFGEIELQDAGGGRLTPVVDENNGERKRVNNGFVNRSEIVSNRKGSKDRLLVIRNLDYAMDFCSEAPGKVAPSSLWIFDKFRDPSVKCGCSLLLVTNVPLDIPFKVRRIVLPPVDKTEAEHIVKKWTSFYRRKGGYQFEFTPTQKTQLVRKLSGLIYTEACDTMAAALAKSGTKDKEGKDTINTIKVLKNLRHEINSNLMRDGNGLSSLTPRPWADYICPKSSNFTYDVNKILRDFDEVNRLKEVQLDYLKEKKDDSEIIKTMEAIQTRMPHVILLYGKGGVGKSAFPIHLAGLLEFDVWNFNVGASHSKWVGEGADNMREALGRIEQSSHVIVRIDEYNRAMGSTSGDSRGMHSAHQQVESEFMNWLQDSHEENLFVKNNIFLVLTTNHKDAITGPMLRSGRIDLVIDIDDFDAESMKETFVSASRRLKHRQIPCAGFETHDDLEKAICELDLEHLAKIATIKGFTVRDIDTLIIEMAAHNYYAKNGMNGLAWNSENFSLVIENSVGSVKSNDTSELVLGDRFILGKEENSEKNTEKQLYFPFCPPSSVSFDMDGFKEKDFFTEV